MEHQEIKKLYEEKVQLSNAQRKDIQVNRNQNLVEALKTQMIPKRAQDFSLDAKRLEVRRTLIESEESDPKGFERIIGVSDLLSINYLSRGIRAAATVCRIRVPSRGGEWYGTGFLVGPGLLMTNNHVISSKREASQCEAEFDYEHDADGVLKTPIQFNLSPEQVFWTDLNLDVTLVAVSGYSDRGIPIDRFGYLPLIPLSGKGINGEWVTIIQHPGGSPKQMTIRDSQIITIDLPNIPDYLIHYSTDTEPGSSGSPVLNDQWQVVAIHHKAVPNPNFDINDSNSPQWLANEGIRISSIYRKLETERFSNPDVYKVLDRLSRSLGLPELLSETSPPLMFEKEGKPLKTTHWQNPKFGYDSKFLPVELNLNSILGSEKSSAAKLKDSTKVILDYLHFSTVINKDRKCPMIAAVNINGSQLTHPGQTSNSWRRDIRLEEEFQPGDNFYVKSQGSDPVSFDRGHMVRRLNPCWGNLTESKLAEKHTFHFTNAAPQIHHYNDIEWGDLEDYVLDRTQTLEKKVTVFSGPIFKEQDPLYGFDREGGPWKIPVTFWKIAVIEKPEDKISAAGFMIGQIEYLQALFEAKVFSGLKPYTFDELKSRKLQTTIKTIEEETGFDFSVLHEFDALDALESTRQTRFINFNSDIII